MYSVSTRMKGHKKLFEVTWSSMWPIVHPVIIRFSARRANFILLLVAQRRALVRERALISFFDITIGRNSSKIRVHIVAIAFACPFRVNIFNINFR